MPHTIDSTPCDALMVDPLAFKEVVNLADAHPGRYEDIDQY